MSARRGWRTPYCRQNSPRSAASPARSLPVRGVVGGMFVLLAAGASSVVLSSGTGGRGNVAIAVVPDQLRKEEQVYVREWTYPVPRRSRGFAVCKARVFRRPRVYCARIRTCWATRLVSCGLRGCVREAEDKGGRHG